MQPNGIHWVQFPPDKMSRCWELPSRGKNQQYPLQSKKTGFPAADSNNRYHKSATASHNVCKIVTPLCHCAVYLSFGLCLVGARARARRKKSFTNPQAHDNQDDLMRKIHRDPAHGSGE
uniref:Uncharacterized protein n=1 Tax=Anopheles culicifacies TaxID=139723 RepID=A0A182LVY9_9DIPT